MFYLANNILFPDRPRLNAIQQTMNNPVNFLNRTVELLPTGVHQDITRAIEKKDYKPYINFSTRGTLWKIAAWTSIFVISALTIGSFVAVGLYYPLYLPFVPLLGFLSIELAGYPAIQGCFHRAEANKREHELRSGANRIYQSQLAHLTPQQVANQIRFLSHDQQPYEIDPQLDWLVHCYDFKPILSEYMFNLEEELLFTSKVQELDRQVSEIRMQINDNPTSDRVEFFRRKMNELCFARQHLSYVRIHIAAQRSILCQPRQNTTIKIGLAPSDTSVDFLAKEMAQNLQNPTARKIFQLFQEPAETYLFPDRNDNLSVMEIEALTIGQLARYITQACRKQPA